MTQIRIYRDSKELPLRVYERIETTGDFFYMIKGYDIGDEIDYDVKLLEEKFNEIVEDFVISVNTKNIDIIQYGKISNSKLEVLKLSTVFRFIELKQKEKLLSDELGLETDLSKINEILSIIKIQRSDDLEEQKKFIKLKIEKYNNEILEALKKIEKNKDSKEVEEQNINDIVVNVELILERQIDMDKTTLYQFGRLQDFAHKKLEKLSKEK